MTDKDEANKSHAAKMETLLSEPLLARCREIQLWRPVRKWEKPSDHIPVSVRLDS